MNLAKVGEETMKHSQNPIITLAKRIFRECGEFGLITAYFYTAFATLLLFKATVLHSYGVHYVVWGAAIVKAVLIAKFMLVGRAMKIGDGSLDGPLIKPILKRVFSFFALLLALTSAEEITRGLMDHRSIAAMFQEFAGARIGETLAEVLILLLVLIPFIAFNVLCEALGEGLLHEMLFRRGAVRVGDASVNPSIDA
jgi:hypothetical protein